MLSKYTYKTKYRALIVCILLMVILVYKFAIAETIAIYKLKIDLEEKSKQLIDAPNKILALENQIAEFENFFSGDLSDTLETRNYILKQTGTFCDENNVKLTQFYPVHIMDMNTYYIETNVIEVEGSFSVLLKYIYNTEHVWKPGKLVSVRFFVQRNLKNKSLKLFAHVYIQKVNTN